MRALDWLNDKLTRVTSNNRFLPEIDGLRFVAIMSVLVFHLMHQTFFSAAQATWTGGGWIGVVNRLVNQGYFGVQLFFVISGFILCLPMAEHNLMGQGQWSLKKYLLRRVTRLEPPYIANLLIMSAILLMAHGWTLGGNAGDPEKANVLPHALASAIYLHRPIYGCPSIINWVAWSLEVEVQFYLVAPLLACVFLIRRRLLRVGIIVAAMALLTLLPNNDRTYWGEIVYHTLAGQLRYFLVGFLLVDIYLCDWQGNPTKSRIWDLIGLLAWGSLPLCIANMWVPSPAWLLVCYISVFRGPVLGRIFTNRWITAIGGMCYTIYLYHSTMLWHLEKYVTVPLFGPPAADQMAMRDLLVEAGELLAVLIASALLFVTLEKPFMRRDWPQRFWGFIKRPFAAPKAQVELEEVDARK